MSLFKAWIGFLLYHSDLYHPAKFLHEGKENPFVFFNIQQHLNNTKPLR